MPVHKYHAIEGNVILDAAVGVSCYEAAATLVAHNNVEGSENAYYASCTLGANNTEYPSLLRDPAAGDFRPTAGSPLRGRGPDGSDIGALPFIPTGEPPTTVGVTALDGRQVGVQWEGAAKRPSGQWTAAKGE